MNFPRGFGKKMIIEPGTTVRVRKQWQASGVRYRYSIAGKDLTLYNLKNSEGFRFAYSPLLKPIDIERVETMWKDKLIKEISNVAE